MQALIWFTCQLLADWCQIKQSQLLQAHLNSVLPILIELVWIIMSMIIQSTFKSINREYHNNHIFSMLATPFSWESADQLTIVYAASLRC